MRLRMRFTKHGKVAFTSHRDLARMWERALRRVQLPVAYSSGFAPRPRISFGLALPTGAESEGEYVDLDLDEGAMVDLSTLPPRLSDALPVGVDVVAAIEVDPREPSLQEAVTSCTWHIEVGGPAASELGNRVAAVLDAPSLVVTRERKGRAVSDDIRPAIFDLVEARPALLAAELATQPRGLRPAEVLAVLGPGVDARRVARISQWIQRDGARREPIPLEATAAPHAEVRAS